MDASALLAPARRYLEQRRRAVAYLARHRTTRGDHTPEQVFELLPDRDKIRNHRRRAEPTTVEQAA